MRPCRAVSAPLVAVAVLGTACGFGQSGGLVELVPFYLTGQALPVFARLPGDPRAEAIRLDRPLVFSVSTGDSIQVAFMSGRRRIGAAWFPVGRHALFVVPEIVKLARGRFSGTEVNVRWVVDEGVPALLAGPVDLWRTLPVTVAVFDGHVEVPLCLGYEAAVNSIVGQAITAVNDAAGLEFFAIYRTAETACGVGSDVAAFLGATTERAVAEAAVTSLPCQPRVSSTKGECVPRRIAHARIDLRHDAATAEATHELLHIVGLRHTCLVTSTMATEFADADIRACGLRRAQLGLTDPLLLARQLSRSDAAALQLVYGQYLGFKGTRVDSTRWIIVVS